MTAFTIDTACYVISILLLVGYHLYLRAKLRRDPSYTIQAINNEARASWVMNIMTEKGLEVLAVQTLRNSTMAATFLASTAILLIFGVLNLLQHTGDLHSIFGFLQQKGSAGDGHDELKLVLLLVDFFTAFFAFSLAVRHYNHVGYLINSSSSRGFCPTPAFVALMLNRSGSYYSIGMRAYYISVPLVFWLLGPYYLTAASFGLVAVLYHVDRAPSLGGELPRDPVERGRSEVPPAEAGRERPAREGRPRLEVRAV